MAITAPDVVNTDLKLISNSILKRSKQSLIKLSSLADNL